MNSYHQPCAFPTCGQGGILSNCELECSCSKAGLHPHRLWEGGSKATQSGQRGFISESMNEVRKMWTLWFLVSCYFCQTLSNVWAIDGSCLGLEARKCQWQQMCLFMQAKRWWNGKCGSSKGSFVSAEQSGSMLWANSSPRDCSISGQHHQQTIVPSLLSILFTWVQQCLCPGGAQAFSSE